MKIYLDNAATTPLDPRVIERMNQVMTENFGNPSSVHSFGRNSRVLVEKARKSIAAHVGTSPSQIIFTSGGTEAINMAFLNAIRDFGIKRIITSPIEHHAVLHTAEYHHTNNNIEFEQLTLNERGEISLEQLDEMLQKPVPTLVALMHANNEIGNLLPLKEVGKLCTKHNALFLCDMVQTFGKFPIDLSKTAINFAPCSAHKFHGPKGSGFLYYNLPKAPGAMLLGGGQERNLRSGTENLYGIAGMAEAFEIAEANMQENMSRIQELKKYLVQQIDQSFPNVHYHGNSKETGLYTILNIGFPRTEKNEMLVYNLDIAGIAVSGGSACTSGSLHESHVQQVLDPEGKYVSLRISLSKFNTKEEIDKLEEELKRVL